jgi:hypothetical protein
MRPALLVTATLAALAASVVAAPAAEIIFNAVLPNDFQSFTAPSTGVYQIISVGGGGGRGNGLGAANNGGEGAAVAGFFTLAQGTTLTIAVGEMGQISLNGGGGGGGGTFVVAPGGILLEAAGGGGGGGGAGKGLDGTTTQSGLNGVIGGAGGANGNGGQAGNFGAPSGGAGGGGYLSSGGTAVVMPALMGSDAVGGGSYIPQAPLLPLIGGEGEVRPNFNSGGDGGFGGGGGGGVGLPGTPSGGGGGGGGYSGGGGGGLTGGGGGGGGSFISALATDPFLVGGLNFGNGEVLIAYDGDVFVNFEDIPEPGSTLLYGAAICAMMMSRRGSASPTSLQVRWKGGPIAALLFVHRDGLT